MYMLCYILIIASLYLSFWQIMNDTIFEFHQNYQNFVSTLRQTQKNANNIIIDVILISMHMDIKLIFQHLVNGFKIWIDVK